MKNALDNQSENKHGRARAKPNGRRAQRVYLESLTSWIVKGEAIYHKGKLLGFRPAKQYRIPFFVAPSSRPNGKVFNRFTKATRQSIGNGSVSKRRKQRHDARDQALGKLRAEEERKIRVSQEDAERLSAAFGQSADPLPFPLHVGNSL